MLATFASMAFRDAYRELDHPDDIANYVAEHFNAAAIANVIGDHQSVTLLAEIESGLAGYAVIKASTPPNCVDDPTAIELARLYLGKAHLGLGYGEMLMWAVHAEARQQGGQTVWLSVYDRNVRAVRFYERFGFVKVGFREFLFGGQIIFDPVYSAPVRTDA